MGNPSEGTELRTFVGVSVGTHGNPARVDEAFESLATQIVEIAQFVTADTGPMTFDVTFMQVEVENQNIRTFRVGATERPGGH
jgi:hypothetical protein